MKFLVLFLAFFVSGILAQDDQRETNYPWLALVYFFNPNTSIHEFVSVGVLTSEMTVVTSASNYRRVAEKYYGKEKFQDIDDKLDVVLGARDMKLRFETRRAVKNVQIHGQLHESENLVVFRFTNHHELDYYHTRAIKIWEGDESVFNSKSSGVVVSYTEAESKIWSENFNFSTCGNAFCGTFEKLSDLDSGSPLVVEIDGEFYLKGIFDSSYKDDARFIDTQKHKKWLKYTTPIDNEICGTTSVASGLIHKGLKSRQSQWPWMASVVKDKVEVWHSGVLISHKVILTAARVISYFKERTYKPQPYPLESFEIFLGAIKPGDFTSEGTLKVHPESFVLRPDTYQNADDPKLWIRNIAFIKLREHVTYTEFIRPACIWKDSNVFTRYKNKLTFSVGYGIDETNTPSYARKHVQVKNLEPKECESIYDEISRPFYAGTAMMCTAPWVSKHWGSRGHPCDHDDALFVKYNSKWTLRGFRTVGETYPNGTCKQGLTLYEDLAPYNWDDWFLSNIDD